jgi:hypothetical protein
MPPKSKAQAAFLGIHHPEVLREWKKEGASWKTSKLPARVGPKKPTHAFNMMGEKAGK